MCSSCFGGRKLLSLLAFNHWRKLHYSVSELERERECVCVYESVIQYATTAVNTRNYPNEQTNKIPFFSNTTSVL